jgi:hypothetical protein
VRLSCNRGPVLALFTLVREKTNYGLNDRGDRGLSNKNIFIEISLLNIKLQPLKHKRLQFEIHKKPEIHHWEDVGKKMILAGNS